MKKIWLRVIISVVFLLFGIFLPINNEWLKIIPFIISYIIIAYDVVIKAFKHIKKGQIFDECFLMLVASVAAFCIKEYPEAVAIMLFYQIGEYLQDYAVDKSRDSIAELVDLRPDTATVIINGELKNVSAKEIEKGQHIIVKAGEKIALDGVVVSGNSSVDNSLLTGESVPYAVGEGSRVYSGSINLSGKLEVEVCESYENSTASKILELVENASKKKARSENFITRFAKIYTPSVVILAICLAVIPPIFTGADTYYDWIYRAISFLVASCPCAIVISVPLSFFAGIGACSRKGILFKGSKYMEAFAKIKTVVFDKTGTLTCGEFELVKINAVNISEDELLKTVAHAEIFSNHPIAEAIKKGYNGKTDESIVKENKELAGFGVHSYIDEKEVYIGNYRLMENIGIKPEKCEKLGSIVYVAVDGEYKGFIAVCDKVKGDTENAIKEIKKLGVKNTVILSGDNKKSVDYVAKKLNIDKAYSELLPGDKLTRLENIIESSDSGEAVVFVGDGINDSPAIARADVGVAMGGLGADVAVESADVVILTDEIKKIAESIKLSTKTLRIVKQNIIFTIIVKLTVLLLSALGLTVMWVAVVADVGVCLIAILNSLRLLKG